MRRPAAGANIWRPAADLKIYGGRRPAAGANICTGRQPPPIFGFAGRIRHLRRQLTQPSRISAARSEGSQVAAELDGAGPLPAILLVAIAGVVDAVIA
jgi:hypothetical protein